VQKEIKGKLSGQSAQSIVPEASHDERPVPLTPSRLCKGQDLSDIDRE
jgi:hypothetical protein